jgi:chromosome segregation ATPase
LQQQSPFDEYLAQQQLQLQEQGEYYEAQIRNLTSSIESLEQREMLRSRQLDAVTERILEVETLYASSQLSLKECQANCTDLAQQRDRLQEEIRNLERQAEEDRERSRQDASQAETLRKELVAAKFQAEELALLIERHRIHRSLASEEEEDDDDEDENNLLYRRSRYPRQQKTRKKKQGFWAWLFGWGGTNRDDRDDELDSGSPDIDDAYTTARSTLLMALQTERNSVHELEAIVASLQQNNSAISEQVKSRDLIVDELNDRIAVFEEDKMVLKAALKQLQKDLNAEAPKTQQLVQNLEAAQVEVKRLKKEMKGLIATHQDEVSALRETISMKEDSLAMTESNLTMIGTYVDRLEARLAEFALVRREIEIREAKCFDIERQAVDAEKERTELQAKVKELQAEHEELRTLMRELAEERAKLLSKNQDLVSEIKTLKAHDSRVQESLAKLNSDYGELVVADMELQHKLDKYEKEALQNAESMSLLKERLASTESNLDELRQELESERSQRKTLLEQLQNAQDVSKQMEERLEHVQVLNDELSLNATRIQKQVRYIR